jgi:hypothetical protein
MRNSASARQSSATPSCVDSAYSLRNASMPPLPWRALRTAATSRRASSAMRSFASIGMSAAARMRAAASFSSMRQLVRTRSRKSLAAGSGRVKTRSMG